MSDRLQPVFDRFPGRETEVRDLCAANTAFSALCRAYCELEERLGHLEEVTVMSDPGAGQALRRRRAAMLQEILALMQQNQRV